MTTGEKTDRNAVEAAASGAKETGMHLGFPTRGEYVLSVADQSEEVGAE
ncbi:MAG: hypothetical protein ACLFWD_05765 [Anaerolineales bacterium]